MDTESHLIWYFIVGALCMLKFVPGAALAIVHKFSFAEQFFATSGGGILGIIVFTYFEKAIGLFWKKYIRRKAKEKTPQPSKADTWHAKLWRRYGIFGAAFLTPPVLSPPIGTALALGFGTPKLKIITYYGISMVFWALVFSLFGKLILHFFDYLFKS